MKYILLMIVVIALGSCATKKPSESMMIIDISDARCLVAHVDSSGIFTCDFRGTYYPATIFDSTITKWFIKCVGNDSLFYYRHFREEVYVWNGRSKNEMYGYVYDMGGASITIPDSYTTDTLRIIRQEWKPK